MLLIENLIINEEYLREGKKQAKEILGAYADHTLKIDDKEQSILKFLDEADPTPSRKYVAVFARMFKKILNYMIENRGFPTEPSEMLVKHKNVLNIQFKTFFELIDSKLIAGAEEKGFKEDISKINDIKELNTILSRTLQKITRSSVKKGVQGLQEGKDFAIVFENKKVLGLMPFSWEASKILASVYVGGCEGKWCIAYQKNKEYWIDYVEQQGQAPVFMIPKENSDRKYSFMFYDNDVDIWNNEDDQLTYQDRNSLLEEFEIDDQMLIQLRKNATKLAEENIEDFNSGIKQKMKLLNIYYELEGDQFNFFVDLSVFVGDEEPEMEDSESTSATIIEGSEFFKNEEGVTLCKKIFDTEDMASYPNILDNCLVIDYGSETPATDLVNHFSSTYNYDDSNYDGYIGGGVLKKESYNTLIFTCNYDASYNEEPLLENFLRYADTSKFDYEIDNDKYYTVYTNAKDLMLDVIKNYPLVNEAYTGEWIQDEEREKKYGQGFLQFEKVQRKLNKRI